MPNKFKNTPKPSLLSPNGGGGGVCNITLGIPLIRDSTGLILGRPQDSATGVNQSSWPALTALRSLQHQASATGAWIHKNKLQARADMYGFTKLSLYQKYGPFLKQLWIHSRQVSTHSRQV